MPSPSAYFWLYNVSIKRDKKPFASRLRAFMNRPDPPRGCSGFRCHVRLGYLNKRNEKMNE